MLFIAMSGAKESMTAQAINTNNLANASTTGFRADFHTVQSQQVMGPGHPSRSYAMVQQGVVDFSAGSITSTGRELDVAINGPGWFVVQASDGSEAYTRTGNFTVDEIGRLVNRSGDAVFGNAGPISLPPFSKLKIGDDGTISIQPLGQTTTTLVQIDRLKLVDPPKDQMTKGADGLMRFENKIDPGEPAEAVASVKVFSGSLEGSNVNTVGALVKMIELARQYERHVKVMKTAEENDQAAAKMIQMS
jgi:flagellar basal-body rod protein FlgF